MTAYPNVTAQLFTALETLQINLSAAEAAVTALTSRLNVLPSRQVPVLSRPVPVPQPLALPVEQHQTHTPPFHETGGAKVLTRSAANVSTRTPAQISQPNFPAPHYRTPPSILESSFSSPFSNAGNNDPVSLFLCPLTASQFPLSASLALNTVCQTVRFHVCAAEAVIARIAVHVRAWMDIDSPLLSSAAISEEKARHPNRDRILCAEVTERLNEFIAMHQLYNSNDVKEQHLQGGNSWQMPFQHVRSIVGDVRSKVIIFFFCALLASAIEATLVLWIRSWLFSGSA